MIRHAGHVLTTLSLVALVLPACADDEGGAAPRRITTTLSDFAIATSSAEAASGTVTFDADNVGAVTHELLVVRTDLPIDRLPVDEAGDVQEDGVGLTFVDEREGIAPGTDVSLPVILQPGRYVLLCNLPGHYAKGMVTAIEVTGDPVATAGPTPSYEVVPASEVIAGLSATVATARGAITDGWTDGAAIAERLYDGWYAYEGTIRATDMDAYLDLEDELASMKRALDAGDQAALATATDGFESLARQYAVEHPG